MPIPQLTFVILNDKMFIYTIRKLRIKLTTEYRQVSHIINLHRARGWKKNKTYSLVAIEVSNIDKTN